MDWGISRGDTGSTVEGISIDTIACSFDSVVHGVWGALSAFSLNIHESTAADTSVGIEVQNLVDPAFRSADGILRVIVVRGNTVGADSLDRIEIWQASADAIDILLVESADNWVWNYNGRCNED